MKAIADLVLRVSELERRQANMIRHGPVEEVDPKKQLVRIGLGVDDQGKPILGPWVPYAQIAGAMKVHSVPSKGQNMTMMNPGGDFRQAVCVPMTWSDNNKSPSEKGEEHVLTFGNVNVTIKDGSVKITVGGHSLDITGDGSIFSGGKIEHDGHLIDKTHVHTEVVKGGALSGPPP